MKANVWVAIGYIWFSCLAFLLVSIMAMANPQSVMDLVHVQLDSSDALSSIRGVYGGVGFSIVFSLLYLSFKDVKMGVIFLSLIWGFYAFSRGITHVLDGPLGDFGTQWMIIEFTLFLVAVIILFRFPSQTKPA